MALKTTAREIIERRDQSRDYMKENYWEAWQEVYRAAKCKTKPLMVRDARGNLVEDDSRTNVAMPELWLIARRKAARLTANPPEIRFGTSGARKNQGPSTPAQGAFAGDDKSIGLFGGVGGAGLNAGVGMFDVRGGTPLASLLRDPDAGGTVDGVAGLGMPGFGSAISSASNAQAGAAVPHVLLHDDLADRLNALRAMIFDRSGEAKEHYKLVQQAVVFGLGISKRYWDRVEVMRRFRYSREKLADRAEVMGLMGAGPEEIRRAVARLGPMLSQVEIAQAIAEYGPELRTEVPVMKYEGPCLKTPFLGDMYWEPGVADLNDSSYVIEEFTETDLWLQKKARETYIDPETGEEKPVMDIKVVEELLEMDGRIDAAKGDNLRNALRRAINQGDAEIEGRLLPGKRFEIIECHETDEHGRKWISWVADKLPGERLGCMPYPWDFYGKWMYTPLVLMPDVISAVGDSSLMALRYLHAVDNANVGQIVDLVSNILRPTMLVDRMEDIPDEMIQRKAFKVMKVKNLNAFRFLDEPSVPGDAWQTQAMILSRMGRAEPSLSTVDTGTESNPMAGRTATTAVLNARASDSLTQDELKNLNVYLKEDGEKVLWMLQQQATDAIQVPMKYARTEALSERYGKTAMITVDPMEIQEDIEVEPVANSMLSVDDELNRSAAMQLYSMASADPMTWNKQEAARMVCRTIPNADERKLINPPAPPAGPMPKVNVSLSVKFEELPEDVQNQLLPMMGLNPSMQLLEEAVSRQQSAISERQEP